MKTEWNSLNIKKKYIFGKYADVGSSGDILRIHAKL
jgi:hypothetical protein